MSSVEAPNRRSNTSWLMGLFLPVPIPFTKFLIGVFLLSLTITSITSLRETPPTFLPEGNFLKLPGSSTRETNFADDLTDLFFAADITDFFEDICRMNHMLRVAILDLYEGRPNEGMRCIQQILQEYSWANGLPVF